MAKENAGDTLETGPLETTEEAAKALEAIPGLLDPDDGTPGEQEEAGDTEATETDDETEEGDDADADDAEADEEGEEDDAGEGEQDESSEIEDLLEGSDAEEDKDLIELQLDGKSVKVPVDELKKGYLRQQDYSQKTEEVAERGRQLAGAEQAFLDERQQYVERMDGLTETLEGQLKSEEADLDKLLDEHPDEYVREKARLEKCQQALADAKAEREGQMAKAKGDQADRFKDYVREESAALMRAVPTFGDPVKGPQLRKALQTHLTGYGFTLDELKGVFDHRTIQVAIDALRWKSLQKSKAKVNKKVANKPKVLKPGAKQPNVSRSKKRSAAAAKRLKQTGDMKDAAVAFEDFV